jgi:HK97 family phage portal protein
MALNLWQRFKSLVTPGQPLGYTQVYTGTMSDTGLYISPQMAMTCTTVNACVQAIATEIAKLPWNVISEEGTGRTIADEHPLHHLLRREANPDMSALAWKELMCMSAALTGNGFSLIERGADGRPTALWYLRPDLMSVIRLGNGQIAYIYSGSEGEQVFTPFDIFHLAWLSPDGVLGYSPISLARQAIGLAIAQETFGASYFRNASRPGGALVSDRELTDEALQRIRESWESRMRGMHAAGSVAILEGGLKWQPMSLSPEDSQWLQSREFQREEICAIFRVPPSVIGIGAKTSYASAEQANREWVGQCLSSWAARLEAEAQRKLLRRDEAFTTEISFDALQKPDLMTRYQTFSIARQFGFLSVNEIRSELGMAGIGEQGDEYLKPTNMVPASNAFGGAKVSPPTEDPEAISGDQIARWLWQELEARDCGTGAGGFQPGNTCAKGGEGSAKPDARALIDFILDPAHNDGFTVDPYVKNQPNEGIMVGIPGHELKLSREALSGPDAEKAIDDWIEGAWDEISQSDDIHIGGWYNASEGVFYLDLSRRFSRDGEPNIAGEHPRAQDALEAAREARQLAVFNLETMKTTWVKYLKEDKRKPDGWDQKYKEWFDGLSPSDKVDASGMGADSVRSTKEQSHEQRQEQGEQQAIHSAARAVEGGVEAAPARSDAEGSEGKFNILEEVFERRHPDQHDLTERNCGTGAGGFQTGNSCATGSTGDAGPSNYLRTHREMVTGSQQDFLSALQNELNAPDLSFSDDSREPSDEFDSEAPEYLYNFEFTGDSGKRVTVEVRLEGERDELTSLDLDAAKTEAEDQAWRMTGSEILAKLRDLGEHGMADSIEASVMTAASDAVSPSDYKDKDGELDENAYDDAIQAAEEEVLSNLDFGDLNRNMRERFVNVLYEGIVESGEYGVGQTYETSPNWDLSFRVNGYFSIVPGGSDSAKGEGLRVLSLVQASIYRMIATQWDKNAPPQNIKFYTPGSSASDPQNHGRMRLYNGMIRRLGKDFGAKIVHQPTRDQLTTGSSGAWEIELSRKNMRSRAKSSRRETIRIVFTYGDQEKRDCGTGAGGFQPGNSCAKGGDGESGGAKFEETTLESGADTNAQFRKMTKEYADEECNGRTPSECDDLQDFENIESEAAIYAYTGDGYTGIVASAAGRDWPHGKGEQELRDAAESEGITSDRSGLQENYPQDEGEDDSDYENRIDEMYEEQYSDMDAIARELHDKINRDTQKCELTQPPPITLFRGMSLTSDAAAGLLEDLKSGQFTSVTVQSWSKSRDIADKFANGEVPVMLVGRGFTTGLDINPKGLSRMAEEREVLVPSNRYKVTRVRIQRSSDGKISGAVVEVAASEETDQ